MFMEKVERYIQQGQPDEADQWLNACDIINTKDLVFVDVHFLKLKLAKANQDKEEKIFCLQTQIYAYLL